MRRGGVRHLRSSIELPVSGLPAVLQSQHLRSPSRPQPAVIADGQPLTITCDGRPDGGVNTIVTTLDDGVVLTLGLDEADAIVNAVTVAIAVGLVVTRSL